MSGCYNGLQAKIIEKEKKVHYVHCAARSLNLVINGVSEVSVFFDKVDTLYVFFQAVLRGVTC